MCGIAGLAASDPRTRPGPSPRADVARMLAMIAHRGPDGEGIEDLPGAVLGHRRLAIIDLSDRASQPMPLRCGGGGGAPPAWVVLNGEIYNYLELRRDLASRGHRLHSDSDTEVVLHLWEEDGDAFARKLRGMFAIALWDARRGRLLLVRDRMGEKPLYYRVGPDGLRFASEVKALVSLARARGEAVNVSGPALRSYLALKYVPGPGTAIEGIRKLPPGGLLVWEGGRAALRRWWSLPLAGQEPAERAALGEELAATLDEAVRLRMRSDVPFGVFLSGGIDSSIVASRMARIASPVRTFTVGFGESDYDEARIAATVARAVGAEHEEILLRPTAAQTADALPGIARHLDQPFADSSAVAVYHLARAVRGHVTVCLSGDGADELFLGYDRYRAHRLADTGGARVAAALAGALVGAIPGAPGRRNFAGRARRFLDAAALGPRDRNDAWVSCFDPALARETLSADFLAAGGEDPLHALHEAYDEAAKGDPLLAVQRADLSVSLPDDMLHKIDSATMAHGLEVRTPFLDHHVVELAMRTPVSLKIGPRGTGRGKIILREVFGAGLPPLVVRGRKAGFGLPLDHWLRGDLAGHARDVLLDGSTLARGITRREGVIALLEDHGSGRANREDAIWALVMLEHWFRSVVDVAEARPEAVREGAGR